MVIEYIANTAIRLKRPFDFSFIHQYGTVFKVFGNPGSGNLCFGVENGGSRYFIKFAGAPKAEYNYASTDKAVQWLKDAKQVYQDLAHDNVIRFINGEKIGGGYAAVFEWIDAESIGSSYPLSRQKFMQLPIQAKQRAFEDILNFHVHVADCGYVAIDFYADQIMYDFESNKTTICDIDFYQKSPYYGDMGKWGSANFVSPEECIPGLRIDEITMVYTMGAAAFSIFADHDRSPESWTLSKPLYNIAKKAVNDDRNLRQQSIGQLVQEWAVCKGDKYRILA